ncbi:HelD family protein [Micrococcus yunnanensis]|uniref:DNA helicase IV n=1 Tax=Micrococcus yunnanensis TaxID=566027 RepID=A0ABR6D429_9MICC|nr:UvrD-helicase domain-containing protein [Micrococcus yunnanensis]MCT1816586.1 AAA family ATPase [Micrococcus luteus]MBA9060492.1 DNA helicase IV [Micrococcus yunnanensis]MCV7523256.1 AAA family ATPase [Micrococcus luteus]MCV7643251.1 AAA family ATPase [Micrococcus luteus]MCV7645637.1 AAA family ATPase [Micrococcus luteus]
MTDTVSVRQSELDLERGRVAERYARLDALREEKERQLAAVRRTGPQGSLQNHSERDAFASLYEDRLAQLYAVDDRLVFGRLDLDAEREGGADEQRYIGRIGLTTEDHERLLVDWRAAEAGAFYQATAAHRGRVRRRRHLMLRGREVRDLEDDILDPTLLGEDGVRADAQGALLAAVTARRTGRMGDIVATIQAEQDEVIRAPLPGAVVVQGGPGTGKTAVALHRAAYLLYTHRERLARSGVLIVGPSTAFMRYIERVLPSLGETGVVMSSLGTLMPGVRAVPEPDLDAAAVKGRLDMVDAVAHAVAQRQRLLVEPRRLMIDGTAVKLKPAMVRRARDKARATRKPHNEARVTFVKILVRELAEKLRKKLEKSSGTPVQRDLLLEDVRTSRDVRIALNLCWMPLTPEKLIGDLLTREDRLRAAAPWLSDAEVGALLRPADAPWTEADVPLLDEAAELLGRLDTPGRGGESAAQHERNLENARASLENMHQTLADLGVDGVVDAEQLAAANEARGVRRTTAETAAHDRTWTYGHVVVDEAQELSPMQWRLLARRCPMKSFTIVGDIAQSSRRDAAGSWASVLAPEFGDRWRLEELTVNYRSPARVMRWAAQVARAAGLEVSHPRAVREGDHRPRLVTEPGGDVAALALDAVEAERDRVPEALTAVIAPAERTGELLTALRERWGEAAVDTAPLPGVEIVVATPWETKGLEFDTVVLVSPERIVADARGVVGDLYVAMTRATQSLSVVAGTDAAALPAGLADVPE